MLRRQILGNYDYIPPNDDAIDFDKFNGADYFINGNMDLPPIIPGKEPAKFTLKQLSGEEMERVLQIQSQNSGGVLTSDWIEYVIRHGVVGWSGLYIGEKPFEIKTENGVITKDNYRELLPFLASVAPIIASTIYQKSLAR